MEGRPPEPTEQDLVRRAKLGDVDAYAQLVRTHERAARRLAYVLCGDDGDDAAQEAFVKAWHSVEDFREEASFRSWLLRVVANQAHNRRRSAGRRSHHELRLAVDRATGGAAPSPEGAVLDDERRRRVLDEVNALPSRLRDVVACRHLLDLSEAETAAALDIPAGTVKSRLSRGLHRIRIALEADDD